MYLWWRRRVPPPGPDRLLRCYQHQLGIYSRFFVQVNPGPLAAALNIAESQIALGVVVQWCPIAPLPVTTLELVQYGFGWLTAMAAGLSLDPGHSWSWLHLSSKLAGNATCGYAQAAGHAEIALLNAVFCQSDEQHMAQADFELGIHGYRESEARHQLHTHAARVRVYADLHAKRLVHGYSVLVSCCDLGDYLFSAGHLDRADVVYLPGFLYEHVGSPMRA